VAGLCHAQPACTAIQVVIKKFEEDFEQSYEIHYNIAVRSYCGKINHSDGFSEIFAFRCRFYGEGVGD
jgi:hypothetical protein